MQNKILKIEGLSHKYSSTWAIRDINIEINKTGITGLLGSNGAGKSTTMNILSGVLKQTEGKVYIDGVDMAENPETAKRKIGFLAQTPPLYMDFTVDEYLTYCGHLRLIPQDEIKSSLEFVKERCGISNFSNRLIKNLSGGYRQRVGIAQAIIHQPTLVVLDEPTNGLDPNQILGVRALIKEIATERAVIFSSHILSEVQLLCDSITMIESGKIVFADSIDSFNNYVEPHSLLLEMNNPPALDSLLKIQGVTHIETLTDRQFRIIFKENKEISQRIIEMSVHHGWQLSEITLEKSNVNEIFAQLSNHHPIKPH